MPRLALIIVPLILSGCLNTEEIIDTFAPDVVILSPIEGDVQSVSQALIVCAHIFDEDPIDALTVELESSLDGPLSPTWDLCAGGNFGTELSLTTLGAHQLTMTATDTAGNTSSSQVSITLNDSAPTNNAPTCAITAPLDGATLNSSDMPTLVATVGDADQAAETLTASLDSDLDGNLWAGSPDTDGRISTNLGDLTTGDHKLELSVTDGADLTTTCELQVTMN